MTKKLLNVLFWLSCFFACSAQAEVEIQFYNAGSQNFTVSETGKIYFNNGYMMIDEGLCSPYSFLVSDIKKILISNPVSIEDIETENFTIYPNPATSFLRIHSDSQLQGSYQLYALDGRVVLSGMFQGDETVDLNGVPRGLYLIKVNDRTFKISKL